MALAEYYLSNMRGRETQGNLDAAGLVSLLAIIPAVAVGSAVTCLPQRTSCEMRQESGTVSYVFAAEPVSARSVKSYAARTGLGRRLMELRQRAIDDGMQLLDADGVEAEILERRGELA